MERDIHNLFIKKGITLSLAESCTGGALAAKLTKLPGASQYFLCSLVAYSNEIKIKLLGLPKKLIEEKGAVSIEVVNAMALRIQELTDSDWSVAISGIAGPEGGTKDKPVGTICFSIINRDHSPQSFLVHCTGSREQIINQSCSLVLEELLKQVNY